MSIYQRNPDALPDSEFEPGELHHLVVGNRGRMLDHRRTPVSIIDLKHEPGFVVLRIDDFEDAGALWEIPFEEIDRYQFEHGSERAAEADLEAIRTVVARLDRRITIPCEQAQRAETEEKIAFAQASCARWLEDNSTFLRDQAALPDAATRLGDARLWSDLRAYMRSMDLWAIEEPFARQFVSAPHAGEIVKGHQIAMAKMGLVPYEGKVVRDAATYQGEWSKEQRAAHIVARLAFVRALFEALRIEHVLLYRGMSIKGRLEPPRNHTFASASFSREVAESHFDAGDATTTRVLIAQPCPVERLFMTYHETEAMNRQFLEAEAVLLWQKDGVAF